MGKNSPDPRKQAREPEKGSPKDTNPEPKRKSWYEDPGEEKLDSFSCDQLKTKLKQIIEVIECYEWVQSGKSPYKTIIDTPEVRAVGPRASAHGTFPQQRNLRPWLKDLERRLKENGCSLSDDERDKISRTCKLIDNLQYSDKSIPHYFSENPGVLTVQQLGIVTNYANFILDFEKRAVFLQEFKDKYSVLRGDELYEEDPGGAAAKIIVLSGGKIVMIARTDRHGYSM